MAYKRDDFAAELGVSRETLADFDHWYALLQKWNNRINLVSKAALDGFWQRHALDSWQICTHISDFSLKKGVQCLDLGSGAGFPGLALAIYLKYARTPVGDVSGGQVLLVEAVQKKASFLRTVIRELDLPAQVSTERAEVIVPQTFDVISARAFAPLPQLLTYAHPFWGSGTEGLFLKGQNISAELTEAQKYWTFDVETVPSRSDPEGVVLKLKALRAKSDRPVISDA